MQRSDNCSDCCSRTQTTRRPLCNNLMKFNGMSENQHSVFHTRQKSHHSYLNSLCTKISTQTGLRTNGWTWARFPKSKAHYGRLPQSAFLNGGPVENATSVQLYRRTMKRDQALAYDSLYRMLWARRNEERVGCMSGDDGSRWPTYCGVLWGSEWLVHRDVNYGHRLHLCEWQNVIWFRTIPLVEFFENRSRIRERAKGRDTFGSTLQEAVCRDHCYRKERKP